MVRIPGGIVRPWFLGLSSPYCLLSGGPALYLGGLPFVLCGEYPSVGKAPYLFEMLFALGSAVVFVILANCYSCSFISGRGTGKNGATLVGLNFSTGF